MSTNDEKTINKPTPVNKNMSVNRVFSTGYEQESNPGKLSKSVLVTQTDENKTKLNLEAKPYVPKGAEFTQRVPLQSNIGTPFIPGNTQHYHQTYNAPMGTYPTIPMTAGRGIPAQPFYQPQMGYPTHYSSYAPMGYSHNPTHYPPTPMQNPMTKSTLIPISSMSHKLNPNAAEFLPKDQRGKGDKIIDKKVEVEEKVDKKIEDKPKLKVDLNKNAKPYVPHAKKVLLEKKTEENKEENKAENVDKDKEKEEKSKEEEKKKEEKPVKKEEVKQQKTNTQEVKKEEPEKKPELTEQKKEATSKLFILLNEKNANVTVSSNTTKPTTTKIHKKYQKSEIERKKQEYAAMLQMQKKKEEEEKERERQRKLQKEKEEREEKERQKKLEAEEKAREEAKKTFIERHYFIVPVNKSEVENKKRVYDIEYMTSFKSWKICQETKLLSKMVLDHLEDFKIFEDEFQKESKNFNKGSKFNKNDNYRNDKKKNDDRKKQINDNFTRGEAAVNDMQQWGRKDISKELQLAEKFKEQLEEIKKADPVKFDLTELLNMLTIDNYEQTKKLIYEKIKDNVEYQFKLLDVLFQKAVHEKAFVSIYAKLCKELDKELPQKVDKGLANKKATSQMRSKLLDKCREIFKVESNEKIEEYIKVKDEDEREVKVKKFILGNVNFIGELINIQLLSKKIVFQCIDNLFKRFEKQEGDKKLRLISLEAIVILTDKFGTLVNKQKQKIKPDDYKLFCNNLENIMTKLDIVQKEAELPGYIKYKIINLIEKKKAGWEETQFEKNMVAKGKEEVRKQFEESQKKGNGNKGKKFDQEQVNDKIREDLNSWKEFIEDGGKLEKYPWDIITDLYSNRQNSLAEILIGFIETCIDFVQNKDNLQYANQYWEELIKYYGPNLHNDERNELIETTLELVSTVSNLALDNNLIYDVWAYILCAMNSTSTMYYKNLDKLQNVYEEDLKSLFVVFKKLEEIDSDNYSKLENLNLVKENKDIFDLA